MQVTKELYSPSTKANLTIFSKRNPQTIHHGSHFFFSRFGIHRIVRSFRCCCSQVRSLYHSNDVYVLTILFSGYGTLAKDGFRASKGLFRSGGRHEEGSYDGSGISTAINAAGNLGSGWMTYHQNKQAAQAQAQGSQRRDLVEELEARDFEELEARTIPIKPFEEAGKFGWNLIKHHKGDIASQGASIGGMYLMNKQPPQQQQSQYQQRDFEQFDARTIPFKPFEEFGEDLFKHHKGDIAQMGSEYYMNKQQPQQSQYQQRDFEQFDARDIDEMYDLASRDFEELEARAFHVGSEVEHGAGRLMRKTHSHPHHGSHRHMADLAQSGSSMMDQMQQSQQAQQQMDPQMQSQQSQSSSSGQLQGREDEFWTRRFVY